MRIICNIFVTFFLLLALPLPVFGIMQQDPSQRIVLEHSDSLRVRHGIRELMGHVRIRRGETVIKSDNALQDQAEGRVVLTGNVHLTEPDRKAKAERMSFNEVSGDFEASRSVDMTVGDSLRIRCDMAKYIKSEGRIDLFGSVVIDNLTDGSRITGKHGRWLVDSKKGVIDEQPVYKLPGKESEDGDTLTILSKKLEFYQDSRSALFTGEVKLTQDALTTYSDTLHHMPDSSRTYLSGNPFIVRDNDQVMGDMMELHYRGKELEKMIIQGNAIALSRRNPESLRYDRLDGNTLMLITVNDSTRRIRADGSAQSRYHVWDKDDVYQGLNLAAANTIDLLIVSDKSREIDLSGRSNGGFYPPGMEPPEPELKRNREIFNRK